MLRHFQPHGHVVQLIGSCDLTFVTEFYHLGSGDRLETVLQAEPYQKHNTIMTRFKLCISYVEAIHFLHTSPLGTRVMCDSNDPQKALSQFLITPDLNLVLNDLDALPEVNTLHGLTIKCGHRDLLGDGVAPEQLWPFQDEEFDYSLMPGYDEKTDIWKIPGVCDVILGAGVVSLRLHLFEIHSQCLEEDPASRPSAADILRVYYQIWKTLYQVSEPQEQDNLL